MQCHRGIDQWPWNAHRSEGADRLAGPRAPEIICQQMGTTPMETSTAMYGTDIVLKHQVSEARFRDLLAKPASAFGKHRPQRATAGATSRHLRGKGNARHAAPPRGLLADAGRGARCVQSSGCVRAPDRAVNAVVATETDAPGGQSARGIVLLSHGRVVSSDGVRTPAAA